MSHGFEQRARVPEREIEAALRRKRAFQASPRTHASRGGIG
jgi:hypothetical protein